MARPTLLNEKMIQDICVNVENGCTFEDARILAGIGQRTFYEWKQWGREDLKEGKDSIYAQFAQELERSLVRFKIFHLQQVWQASTKRKQWQASAWLLERKFFKEFGRKALIRMGGKVAIDDQSRDKLDKIFNGKPVGKLDPLLVEKFNGGGNGSGNGTGRVEDVDEE